MHIFHVCASFMERSRHERRAQSLAEPDYRGTALANRFLARLACCKTTAGHENRGVRDYRMDFRERIHPEFRLDGFTKLDGTITFYSCIRALMLRTESKEVLDFGAGRGQF